MITIKRKAFALSVIFLLVLVLTVPSLSLAKGYTHVYVEGTEIFLKNSPRHINGTLCVPFEEFCEIFGGKVLDPDETQTIVAIFDEAELSVKIGNPTAEFKGEEVLLDADPVIINSAVYVPVDFICKIVGARVTLSGDNTRLDIRRPSAWEKVMLYPDAQMNVNVGKETVITANPTGEYSLFNMNTTGEKASVYYKFSYEEIGDFASAKLVVPMNRVNAAGTLSLYKMTEEWTNSRFGSYELGASGKIIIPEGNKLPETEGEAFAEKSDLVYGQTTFYINLTEYLKKEVEAGSKSIGMYFCYNTLKTTDTADGIRINNLNSDITDKVRIELTYKPHVLNLNGKSLGKTEKFDIESSVRIKEVNSIVIGSVTDRASSGDEINSIASFNNESSIICYEAKVLVKDNAFLTVSARSNSKGTLNLYKATLSDNGKIKAAENILDSQFIEPSDSYAEVSLDVSNAVEDGKICVMLEFIPEDEVRQSRFYIKSLGSETPPYVYSVRQVN